MKISRIIAGVLVSLICYFNYFETVKEFEVQKFGKIVTMKIIAIPGACTGTKVKYFMKLQETRTNKIFITQIGAQYCDEHALGEIVKMKILDKYNIVLFPKETVELEFYSLGLIFLFGFLFMLSGLPIYGR